MFPGTYLYGLFLILVFGTCVQNLTAPFTYALCNFFKKVSVYRFVSMTFPWKPHGKLITVSYEETAFQSDDSVVSRQCILYFFQKSTSRPVFPLRV
jgi:hypothetical protein